MISVTFRYTEFYSAKKPCCLTEVKIKPCLTCVIFHWSACCHCHQIFLSFIFILDIMHFWKCVHKSSHKQEWCFLFNCHQWWLFGMLLYGCLGILESCIVFNICQYAFMIRRMLYQIIENNVMYVLHKCWVKAVIITKLKKKNLSIEFI